MIGTVYARSQAIPVVEIFGAAIDAGGIIALVNSSISSDYPAPLANSPFIDFQGGKR
jgi:hypothetical protein